MPGQFVDEYPPNAKSLTGPGCFSCGAPRRKDERIYQFSSVVDEIEELDGTIHSYRVVVLCEQCIVELAGLIGCATPQAAAGLKSRIAQLNDRVEELEGALGTREDLNRTLHRLTELAGDMTPSA